MIGAGAAILFAGFGAVTSATSDSSGLLAAKYSSVQSDYAGLGNGTNAEDVSRNYDRALAKQAPQQAAQKEQALAEFNASTLKASTEQATKMAKQWVLPVAGYRLSARFGQSSSLWSSGSHTGLDFAGPSGSQIVSVAAGTVTKTGFDGAYGLATVITLEDGTNIKYAHQSSASVTVGQKVGPGEVIGHTGSTGNSTGPHLHLEVILPGGNQVDPFAALVEHNVQP